MAIGTNTSPLRVAIIGSGPAAFYAAEHLFKQPGLSVQADMFERLPTPYGLVRGGVAPDHQKIKTVTKVFEKLASDPRFRFYGNVEYGKDISLDDLKDHYHMIVFATGAQSDRHMGIPGEDLIGSHPATEFVAWYNGHPDFRNCQFDLSQESVAVVGVGNVAIDVARILSLTEAELAKTDIADYAFEALKASRVKQVHLLGRRGPAQAAFTNPEIKELGDLAGADVIVKPEEAELDPLSREEVNSSADPTLRRKVEILEAYSRNKATGKPRVLYIRFLVSPVELIGDAAGHVVNLKLVHNVLYKTEAGTLSPKPTDQFEDLPVGMVFRSVGYRGLPLPGIPFNDRWGVVLNTKGRIVEPETKHPLPGEYVTGWIKRGPSGVIGTNKPDSVETVNMMLEDLARDVMLQPRHSDRDSIEQLVKERQPKFFSFADWLKLDQIEVANGQNKGKPRVKFTKVDEMLAALGR